MKIKTVACDFDNTLTQGDFYPIIKGINTEAVSVLAELQKRGGKVILFTAREQQQLVFALAALKDSGFVPDYVNDNTPHDIRKYKNNCRKIMSDIYIDDRCIDYTGDWAKYRKILIDDNPVSPFARRN